MIASPRIVVIDDRKDHLQGLVQGLSKNGLACLQILFDASSSDYAKCPHARVIFADLHLNETGTSSEAQHYTILATIIKEGIAPVGPFMVVLWTKYPRQATELKTFFEERTPTCQPMDVIPLDKNEWLDAQGQVNNPASLSERLRELLGQQQHLACLTDWEAHVLGAAAETITDILNLAKKDKTAAQHKNALRSLLCQLGIAAMGQHAENDPFMSLNEALLPILADRLAQRRQHLQAEDRQRWQTTFKEAASVGSPSESEAAKLNSVLHLDTITTETTGDARGAAIRLPVQYIADPFEWFFGSKEVDLCKKEFNCTSETPMNWLLIQIEAACDYNQKASAPKPYILAIEVTTAHVDKKNKPTKSMWKSPAMLIDDTIKYIHANSRFQVSLPTSCTRELRPKYRLRDQILNELIYAAHTHGARPGIYELRHNPKSLQTAASTSVAVLVPSPAEKAAAPPTAAPKGAAPRRAEKAAVPPAATQKVAAPRSAEKAAAPPAAIQKAADIPAAETDCAPRTGEPAAATSAAAAAKAGAPPACEKVPVSSSTGASKQVSEPKKAGGGSDSSEELPPSKE